jgi:hypothetical protein
METAALLAALEAQGAGEEVLVLAALSILQLSSMKLCTIEDGRKLLFPPPLSLVLLLLPYSCEGLVCLLRRDFKRSIADRGEGGHLNRFRSTNS